MGVGPACAAALAPAAGRECETCVQRTLAD